MDTKKQLSKKKNDGRFERKFVITNLDKDSILSVIKHNSGLFSEIFHERIVNNIYLDSFDLTSYEDNVIGSSDRSKFRIRWYGNTFGKVERPILEIKSKSSDVGFKKSFELNSFIVNDSFSFEKVIKCLDSESNLPKSVLNNLKSLHLSLLNRYRRRYFLSADKKFRLTLDYDLEYFRIDNVSNRFIDNIKENDVFIVELKYDKSYDNFAKKITDEFPFRLNKNSKYVNGVDYMHFDLNEG